MSFGAFMLIKKINYAGKKIYAAVRDISAMSYGMYLMHMLILPFIYGWLSPLILPPFAILSTAVLAYISCYVITKLISYLKLGKYIIG